MIKRLVLTVTFLVLLVSVLILSYLLWTNRKSANAEQQITSSVEADIQVQQETPDTNVPVSDSIGEITEKAQEFDYSEVADFSGSAVQIINGNVPFFEDADKRDYGFEKYSDLDELGRCGEAFACVGIETMPTEERGSIGMIKPSGWQTIKYDFIDGKYLYNRCHLIGYQLAGENDLAENLITGTRYLNIEGMLPYENMVSDYVSSSNNHVLYRVTPIFLEDNLVASGVLMEGMSVEDRGEGLSFCVFAYNVQPGIDINYLTGESVQQTETELFEIYGEDTPDIIERVFNEDDQTSVSQEKLENVTYIGNKNSHRFHYPDCEGVSDMKEENKVYFYGDRNELIEAGYIPCGSCNP